MAWDATKYNGWEWLKDLGEGGQGRVYLVRSREARNEMDKALKDIETAVAALGAVSDHPPLVDAKNLAVAVAAYSATISKGPHGALKVFKQPEKPEEAERASKRFTNELEVLRANRHPALLGLLDQGDGWMVTEYHPGGTLAKDITTVYAGDPVKALKALRPVIEAVALLHEQAIVHRDIKPDNIFNASDGRLVLGDFGIVFLERGTTRVTDTMEKVGTTDWMPGWAMGMRPDDVTPKFDVFALGKILYCMVAGRPKLPLWYHGRAGNRLGELFAMKREMQLVQRLLDSTVCENEGDCEPATARVLLGRVDDALATLNAGGEILRRAFPRLCRVCARGRYVRVFPEERLIACVEPGKAGQFANHLPLYDPARNQCLAVTAFLCEACGHIEFFRLGDRPPVWQD